MAVTFVGAGTAVAVNSSGSVQPPLPSGLLPGDVLVCFVGNTNVGTPSTWTISAGWASPRAWYYNSTTDARGGWSTRVYQLGDAAPTVTFGSGNANLAVIAAFRDVDASSLSDALGGVSSEGTPVGTTGSITPPGTTLSSAGGMALAVVVQYDDTGLSTADAAWTETVHALTAEGNDQTLGVWRRSYATDNGGSSDSVTVSGNSFAKVATQIALWPVTSQDFSGTLDRTGSGSLSFPTRTPRVSGSLARTGSGSLSLTPTPRFSGSLARTGSGSLSFPSATPAVSGSLARTAEGTSEFFSNIAHGSMDRTAEGSLTVEPSLVTASTPYTQQEAVQDGSFEGVSWTSEPPRWSVDTTVARTGSRSMKAVASGTSGHSYQIGSFPVRPGDTVRIAAWRLTTADYNGTPSNGKLRLANQNNGIVAAATWEAGTSWAERVINYTVPSNGSVTELLVSLVGDHSTGTLWIDDVSVQVPRPSLARTGSGSLTFPVLTPHMVGVLNRLASSELSMTPGGITTALQAWDATAGEWRPVVVRAWDSTAGLWKLVAGRRWDGSSWS